ncbi:MAG: ABC transporter permease, partial [Candidatus Cloacimonas sp.]|nr:ABC transporter permease [Candidatus Cloacimonas sp.]
MPSSERIIAIATKELHHIMHDSRTLIILILMPLVQLIIFGYAMNMEIRHVPLAIIDYARNSESKSLRESFSHSEYFSVFSLEEKQRNPEQLFFNRKAQAILIIPQGFGVDEEDLQLLIDASEPNNAQLIQSYVTGIINSNFAVATPLEIKP